MKPGGKNVQHGTTRYKGENWIWDYYLVQRKVFRREDVKKTKKLTAKSDTHTQHTHTDTVDGHAAIESVSVLTGLYCLCSCVNLPLNAFAFMKEYIKEHVGPPLCFRDTPSFIDLMYMV